MTPDGKPAGPTIEIFTEACRRLNIPIVWVHAPEGPEPNLRSGKVDLWPLIVLALFMDVGAAWESDTSPDYHRGIGAELIFEPKLGYLFGLQSRAGIAKGLDATGSTKIYLRAGRTF